MSRRPSEKVLPSACFETVQVSVIHAESQTLGPETAKLRGPYVDVDVLGTSRSPYFAERSGSVRVRTRVRVTTPSRGAPGGGVISGDIFGTGLSPAGLSARFDLESFTEHVDQSLVTHAYL